MDALILKDDTNLVTVLIDLCIYQMSPDLNFFVGISNHAILVWSFEKAHLSLLKRRTLSLLKRQ